MKQLVWATLLAGNAVAAAPECAHTSREHYVGGWEETRSVELVHQRITPEGIVDCTFLPDREQRLNVLARYEQGTLNGAGYKVHYSDGSGVIQGNSNNPPSLADYTGNWQLVCKPGGAVPLYRCTLSKGDLRLQQATDGRQHLDIGEEHRQDSELLLRVDSNRAVTAPAASGFSAAQVQQLLAELVSGKTAHTGYHSPGLQGATEKTLSLYGFSQALEIMDKVLDQLKTPPAEQQ